MHNKKSRRIKMFSKEELAADLERYQEAALSLGASAAKAITTENVYVDPRVGLKCMVPKCPGYGSCAHCPPYAMAPEKVKELVQLYKFALLVKIHMEPSMLAGNKVRTIEKDGKPVPSKTMMKLFQSCRKMTDIVTDIESQAFYDGHYLATAFSVGSCHSYLCNRKECLVLKNQPCRFPLKSRPSMEAFGIDVYKTVTQAGWDIYPIGSDCNPELVPRGNLVGLVLVD